jgi:hypothetical protein
MGSLRGGRGRIGGEGWEGVVAMGVAYSTKDEVRLTYAKARSREMKAPKIIFTALIVSACQGNHAAISQTIDNPLYMGKASTGESVYYYGGRAQCGDLPRSDTCWKNPMIAYTLGNEEFNTVLDCQKKIFSEALSVTTGKRYKAVAPSSAATRRMVAMACADAAKQY